MNNRVYYKGKLLSAEEMAREVNKTTYFPRYTFSDFTGPNSRISGKICWCKNGGDFELLPERDEYVVKDKTRYMVCLNCGGWSHL